MNQCVTEVIEGANWICIRGEVDLSWSAQIRKMVLAALDSNKPSFVDLSEVNYIDSSGIAALVEGYQKARRESLTFGLVSVSKQVMAVLELARLNEVFPIYKDRKLALVSVA